MGWDGIDPNAGADGGYDSDTAAVLAAISAATQGLTNNGDGTFTGPTGITYTLDFSEYETSGIVKRNSEGRAPTGPAGPGPTHLQSTTINGKVYNYNPVTGEYTDTGLTDGSSSGTNLQHVTVDGKLYSFNPVTGEYKLAGGGAGSAYGFNSSADAEAFANATKNATPAEIAAMQQLASGANATGTSAYDYAAQLQKNQMDQQISQANLDLAYAKMTFDEKQQAAQLQYQYMNAGLDANAARQQALSTLIANKNNNATNVAQASQAAAAQAAQFAANPRDAVAELMYRNAQGLTSTPMGSTSNDAFGGYQNALAQKFQDLFGGAAGDMQKAREQRDAPLPSEFSNPISVTAPQLSTTTYKAPQLGAVTPPAAAPTPAASPAQQNLNQFAAQQYTKDPAAFKAWTTATAPQAAAPAAPKQDANRANQIKAYAAYHPDDQAAQMQAAWLAYHPDEPIPFAKGGTITMSNKRPRAFATGGTVNMQPVNYGPIQSPMQLQPPMGPLRPMPTPSDPLDQPYVRGPLDPIRPMGPRGMFAPVGGAGGTPYITPQDQMNPLSGGAGGYMPPMGGDQMPWSVSDPGFRGPQKPFGGVPDHSLPAYVGPAKPGSDMIGGNTLGAPALPPWQAPHQFNMGQMQAALQGAPRGTAFPGANNGLHPNRGPSVPMGAPPLSPLPPLDPWKAGMLGRPGDGPRPSNPGDLFAQYSRGPLDPIGPQNPRAFAAPRQFAMGGNIGQTMDGYRPASSSGGTNMNIHELSYVVGAKSGHIYATLGEHGYPEQLKITPTKEGKEYAQMLDKQKKMAAQGGDGDKQMAKQFAEGGTVTIGADFIAGLRKSLQGYDKQAQAVAGQALPDPRLLAAGVYNQTQHDPNLKGYIESAYSSQGISPEQLWSTVDQFRPQGLAQTSVRYA